MSEPPLTRDEIFDIIVNTQFDLLLKEDNDRGPGLFIFRLLKIPKTIDGKTTNCEMFHVEFGGKGWDEMESGIEKTSNPRGKYLFDLYTSAPEKYVFFSLTFALDESASFSNFYFRVYDHNKKMC